MWVLSNVSFAGMRAQNNPSVFWRILAFIFGLPGTIVTFIVFNEGSDRAYTSICPEGKGRIFFHTQPFGCETFMPLPYSCRSASIG